MYSIFFDLETSERNFVGQIVNYAFITVDDCWNTVSSFCGDIKISRLNLPDAGAILANRVNVIEHQAAQYPSEKDAMRKISAYINEVIDKAPRKKVALIGYNSSKFDVPFLRTSLIRNGLNPYFGGKIVYRDLLHVVRYLECFNKDFPRAPATDPEVLSLKMETITKELGILEGKQKHHSLADVELTIKLAKCLAEDFNVDVRSSDTYQAGNVEKGEIFYEVTPNYDLTQKERQSVRPVMCLDDSPKYALWVDLERFKDDKTKASIRWYNKSMSAFFVKPLEYLERELEDLAKEALTVYQDINLSNFFDVSSCDIEQDIYRLPLDGLDILHRAIWEDDVEPLKSYPKREAKVLYLRNQIANADKLDSRMSEVFKKYAEYRYGGDDEYSAIQLRKTITDPEDSENYGRSYKAGLSEIVERLSSCEDESDKTLLKALEKFYKGSEIAAALGIA